MHISHTKQKIQICSRIKTRSQCIPEYIINEVDQILATLHLFNKQIITCSEKGKVLLESLFLKLITSHKDITRQNYFSANKCKEKNICLSDNNTRK